MSGVVGREEVLATAERLLDTQRPGFAALVLEGEPGIGKTAVWREVVERAATAGYDVLRSRPAAAEATLAFASLTDLLGVLPLDGLPEPQREALEAAMLGTAGRRTAEGRAVGSGVRSLLSSLAGRPTLLAVDDAQWLDQSSESALIYALRRVDPSTPLRVLLAVRVADEDAPASALVDALEVGVERVRLGPLGLSSLYHVIHSELDLVFPRPVLQRIEQASGGNPLFALELARALAEEGRPPTSGEPLPVPESLGGLLKRRIAQLPAEVREVLLLCALAARPTTDLVEGVLGPRASGLLEHALDATIIELRAADVRFAHPLLASTVAGSALPSRRQTMHRRLAEATATPQEQARHLALASKGPDETVAARLEDAARDAWGRGASADAIELAELACRFTPPEPAGCLAGRRVDLAAMLQHAGDSREAARVLDDVLAARITGPIRARALELRAQIYWVDGTVSDSEACCDEALAHAGDDERLRARVLVTLARVTLDEATRLGRAQLAVQAIESMASPDLGLLSEALIGVAGAEYYLGRGIQMDVVERALALEREAPPANVSDRMSAALGTWLKYLGDFDGARHWLEGTRRAAIDEGDDGSLPFALGHLAQLELWTGHWDDAERRALEHLELAERAGQSNEILTAVYNLCMVEAHRGRVDVARERLTTALAGAEGWDEWSKYQLLSALGFTELTAHRPHEAVASLAEAFEIYQSSGAGDTPGVFENYAEALVGVGELDRAEEVVGIYEQRARTSGKALTLAPALRCRALVAEAHGDLESAAALLEEALANHDEVAMPFSRARTQLVVGRVERHRGRRRASREALEAAMSTFAGLGAPPWADAARRELARVPIRRRVADDGLTPTEERVTGLVAEGLTNKEIARALFVTEKTVEANLTRIYRKLGVRSRAALAARPAAKP